LKGPQLAYYVEKLVSAGILIKFDQMPKFNSMILPGHISAETPGYSEKGVFQQNRGGNRP
jgi:hypothetical protein